MHDSLAFVSCRVIRWKTKYFIRYEKGEKMTSYHNLSRQSNISRKALGSSIISQSSYGLKSSSSRHGGNRVKKKKVTQSALIRRGQYKVIDDFGFDKTPKLLYDPDYQVLEEWQPTVLDYVEADVTSIGSQTSLVRNFQSTALSYGSRNSHTISLQMSFTNIANVESYREATKQVEGGSNSGVLSDDRVSESPPSAFRLKYVPSREFFPPHSKVPLKFKETESMTFFSLNSVVDCASTAEGMRTQKDNIYYEYITEGRGKHARKLNTSEQQTITHISTSQCNYIGRKGRKNSGTWVTAWKIFDEYADTLDDTTGETQLMPVEQQWAHLQEDERFLTQALIMERILGCQEYRDIQLKYKKAMRSDPSDMGVQFVYSTETLWTYHTDKVQNRAVSAIAVNTLFPDIIAVGYGKLLFKEPDKGFVCLWSVKNPKNPERFYRFASRVTCLDFAEWSPNVLAAGFADGSLLVLDVKSNTKKVLFSKDSNICETYESILFVKWWVFFDIYGKKEERLMMTTGDGRIIQLRRRFDALVPFQMMRTTRAEGKLKGINCLRRCDVEEIPMLRFPAARSVIQYPRDNQFYLVSADDGSIHKCSTNYFSQHVDVFLAHSGPVYALKFSPFCSRIFLTCGADGAVRLWAWDITEPLITLTTGPAAVVDAVWSTRNSTIIMSISGPCLYIWDLTRKTYFPASTHYHPTNAEFTTLQFSDTGDNVIIGDVEGNVMVLGLFGMPFDQIFKEDALAASIEKEVIVRPKLLKLLKKSGPPFTRL